MTQLTADDVHIVLCKLIAWMLCVRSSKIKTAVTSTDLVLSGRVNDCW